MLIECIMKYITELVVNIYSFEELGSGLEGIINLNKVYTNYKILEYCMNSNLLK
jgi:hypothetical protein